MRKRIIAFVLAFMMVLGLLPGTGLENVLADNAGEEESSTDVTGLLVCDYLGNNEPAKQKECWVWVNYGNPFYFYKYDTNGENKIFYSAEELGIESTDNTGNAELTDYDKYENGIDVVVDSVGDYKVYVKGEPDDYVTIHEVYPDVAFYTSSEMSVSSVIGTYGKKYEKLDGNDNVVYLIKNFSEEMANKE